jgi:hypothetical protein
MVAASSVSVAAQNAVIGQSVVSETEEGFKIPQVQRVAAQWLGSAVA